MEIVRARASRQAFTRALAVGMAALLAGCGGSDEPPAAPATAPAAYRFDTDTVKVASGTLGASEESSAAVRIFKAIPYAAPPVGPLRWQPPRPATLWTGTRKNNNFSIACTQGQGSVLTSILYTSSPSSGENCLFLNVWTPAASAAEKRPVMVLLFGGGNATGTASNPTYDGAGLAKKGVVVVSFNYRLGVFGWLAHPELSAESPNKVSGNYGLLDQIAALQWVQANIAAFGGDPANVTLYSQSAGGWNAHLLMTSPLAKGLFHKALLGSGGVFPGARGNSRTLAQAEASGSAFAVTAKAANLAALRSMLASDLQAISNGFPPGHNIDGYVLPDQVDLVFRAGKAADIPIMTGSNSDEQTVFPPGFATTLAGFQTTAASVFGAGAAQVQSMYGVTDDASAAAVRFILPRDFELAWQPYTLARTMVTGSTSKVYLYLFNRVPPYYPEQRNYTEAADPATLGAYHTIEQVYLYNNLAQTPRPYTAVDLRLADIASTYLVNFATSGDPNVPVTTTADGNAVPQWPAFTVPGGRLMLLGDVIAPASEPQQAALDLFDAIFVQNLGRPLAFQ